MSRSHNEMTIDLRGTRKFYYLTAILLLVVSVWLLLSGFTPVQAADDALVESMAVTRWHERAGAKESKRDQGARVKSTPTPMLIIPDRTTPFIGSVGDIIPNETGERFPMHFGDPSPQAPACSQCEPTGLPLAMPDNEPVYVTCRFRDPNQPQHSGLDFPIDKYTEIAATQDGLVVVAEYDPVYGNLVVIENQQWETHYAHASYLLVRKGDLVQAGDVIALAGSTGTSSGDHLHYEVRDALDTARNPENFMDMTQIEFSTCE